MNIAVIFAGGTGKRMNGGGVPKQFLEYRDKPIIIYTLEIFERHPHIDAVVVACIKSHIPQLEALIEKYGLKKVKGIVEGGSTSQESIYNGLEKAAEFAGEGSIVLVHDGVRPLIDEQTITDNIATVKKSGTCVTCVPAIETILISGKDDSMSIPARSDCKVARAPQSFFLADILKAHRLALKEGLHDFIDCCTMMHHYGYDIHTVEGPVENIKITTPTDFYLFKAWMEIRDKRETMYRHQ